MAKTKQSSPYQDTEERAIEPQPSPQQYRPKDLRSRKPEIRSEQRPDSRLHAQPNSRSGLRDRLQNPKRRLLRQCRQNPSHRRSMTKGLTPDTELLSSEGKLQKQRNKQGDREDESSGGAKGKTRREKRRGASGVGTNVSAGRRPEPPSTGAESRSDSS
ncbi:hypothetical protein YC2023_052732 [Brassica napus]